MPDNKCHNRLLSLLSSQEWHLDRLYAEYSRQFAFIFQNHTGNITKLQKRQLERTLARFHDDLEKTLASQIKNSFSISNLCNDEMAERYIKNMEVPEGQVKQIFKTNPGAVAAFMARKAGGLNLSDRVWSLTRQTEESLLNVLETGIFDGRPAADMARDLKQYLKEPNRRFRRVRNEQGKLILSNPAKEYHPGQGVYRSSYKNALRLSRNEVNIAYRTNDHSRRQNMPFVMGQLIQLSAVHPALCICDHMVGTYPKEYFFTGFHTNCLCFSTSILLPREKFKDYLGGGSIDQRHQIRTIPKRAMDYLNSNADKLKSYKNPPYFLKDNFKPTKTGFKVAI